MTRQIRSRRAGLRDEGRARPVYARLLRLRHLQPSGLLCFIYLEGTVALGVLLALAELVSWWGVLVLPLTVALMVKLNDVVAGVLAPSSSPGSGGGDVWSPGIAPSGRGRPAFAGTPGSVRSRRTHAFRPPGAVGNPPGAVGNGGTDLPVPGRPADQDGGWSGPGDDASPPPARHGGEDPLPAGTETGALNAQPIAPSEQLDSPHRWARQSASRRYR